MSGSGAPYKTLFRGKRSTGLSAGFYLPAPGRFPAMAVEGQTERTTMENQEGTSAVATRPGDEFTHAWAAFEAALAAKRHATMKVEQAKLRQTERINALPEADRADTSTLEAIASELMLEDLGSAAYGAICAVEVAFREMMAIPAPDPFALHLKLKAISDFDPPEAQYYLDRLIADAGSVSLQPAKAWVDRWRALGGDFGSMQRAGGTPTFTRGMVVDLDLWKPTDREHPLLAPHAWLIEPEHHAGAVKVLEGFLALVPGLQDSIRALVVPTIPAFVGEA